MLWQRRQRFRRRIHAVFERWIAAVAAELKRGKRSGKVAARLDPQQAALFVIASLEGGIAMAKQSCDRQAVGAFTAAMRSYHSARDQGPPYYRAGGAYSCKTPSPSGTS